MPDVGNPVYASMVESIQEVARAHGLRLMLHSTGADAEDELAMVRDLKHRYVDGLILVSLHLTEAHADELRRAAAPVIVIGRPTKGTPVDSVRAYSRKGAAEAVRHLHAAGRRRIAFVNGPPHTAPGSSRRLGYLDGLRSCGIARDDALMRGRRRLHDRAGAHARPPACSSGRSPMRSSARTTCSRSARSRRCARQGSTSPATSRWSGMDNTTLAEVTWPTLTSVDLGSAERARLAAELLLERIEGLADEPRMLGVEPRLVVRASSGASVMSDRPRGRQADLPRGGRSRAGVGLSGRETMLLLIPALLPIVILSVIPLVRGIYLGFTDAQAGFEITTNFIGLDNFRALLEDDLFVKSFKIGLIWSVAVTAIGFCFALGLALLLSQDLKGRWLARSLALVPWAMPAVVVGIMWKLFFQPQAGILNEILRRTHIPGETTDWLSSFTWALPAVILVGVWAGMPQTTVALLAGLQSIQDELHEAAAVDGATAWQRFRTITLPQLRPVIIAITTLDFIWNFNSFGLVYVLTEGGPAGKTQLPMLFAYSQAFEYGQFGYASALGSAMVIVIACVLVFYLWGRLKETR